MPALLREAAIVFIQFGTGLCLLFAAMERLRREHSATYWLTISTTVCLASIQLRIGFFVSKTIGSWPTSAIFIITSIFLIGPVVYRLAIRMLGISEVKKEIFWLHYIPAGVAFVGEIYFFARPLAYQKQVMAMAEQQFTFDLLHVASILGAAHVLGYFLYLLKVNLELKQEYDIKYTKLVWGILLTPTAGIICLITAFVIKNEYLFVFGGSLLTVTCTFFFLFTAKYPHFFETLRHDIRQKRYATTQLTGVNVEQVQKRLHELMSEEFIYRDDTLRLQSLAEELLISGHQLSRILNESYGKNFNEFLNEYRINEAKKLLVTQPERPVLSIGYEVGFSTKTTFNAQFLKLTGKTPAEFRKKKK